MQKKILIIGAGNVGTSLYRLLSEFYPGKVHLYGRKEAIRATFSYLKEEDYSNFLTVDLMSGIDVIFLTVPDDYIKEASRLIHLYPLSGKRIFHTSGAKDSSEIRHLVSRGATVGCLHPMQSFAKKYADPDVWKGIVCSFEGDDACFKIASTYCEKTDAHLIRVTPDQKVAIHVAGVFTANFTVALLNIAEKILTQAGVTEIPKNEILYPLLAGVAQNYKQAPSDEILTGPIKRGDIKVIRKHIAYLQLRKIDTSLYLKLAELLLDNPHFEIKNSQRIKELMKKFRR